MPKTAKVMRYPTKATMLINPIPQATNIETLKAGSRKTEPNIADPP